MLVQFSVTNFLSFRERATLSMVASDDPDLECNVHRGRGPGRVDLLRSAAIFGANASGKSNFIKAFRHMRSRVLGEAAEPGLSRYERFRLDRQSRDLPSEFEAVMMIGGVRFTYGFSADGSGAGFERLHSHPASRRRLIFERERSSDGRVTTRRGQGWKPEGLAAGKSGRAASPDALLLCEAADLRDPVALSVRKWFAKCRLLLPRMEPELSTEARIAVRLGKSVEFRRRLTDFLRHMDLDIHEVRAGDSGIELVHRGGDPEGARYEVCFGPEDESDGTRRLIALGAVIVTALQEGAPVILDEMDTRLHPLLVAPIVRMFHTPSLNRRGAQLVFSTHACHPLGLHLLRRDQIWFVERDQKSGASRLISLWDFKNEHPGESIEKGYLAGRYGAIPLVGEPEEW